MDNYQGDLTDILRASGGALGQSDAPVSNWEFPFDPSSTMGESRGNLFGDPFCNMRDPLLHELNVAAGSSYFSSQNSADHVLGATSVDHDHTSSFVGANSATTSSSGSILAHQRVFEDHEIHKAATPPPAPCNIFSRIQISPNNPPKLPVSPCNSPVIATGSSPRGFKPSAMVSSDIINVNSSKGCLMESTGQVQISSPRNMGIKRRKSQAKKVVCIPAPAAANSRPGGEVVPSDLWAWRKYGQKPIKGSPYPRGYYRCSSSKGCSARKQVERSRTDPNMLVITYTSEHNHPWPTQRNALAGSTRSQPLKSTAASKSPTGSQSQKTGNTKEEQKESSNDTLSPTNIVGGRSTASASVKEEFDDIDKQMGMDDNDFSEGFSHSYKPSMPDQSDQDFFAELGEIDADPLDLLFTQEFNGDEQKESKDLDPFSIFDWSGDTNTSFGEAKKGL
ncbi:WRKY transcription factor 14 [Populus alba x Populus x berolinensis]|uniref:WRKY transcription factor 14 n=1 Tax=Populus alba x Populus x berolinensis TaxID=444605 RepID=A0AAD6RUB1_9ROSI|nr:WRKY transcription factor 14 [Populus alba x Populus x berolinensis]